MINEPVKNDSINLTESYRFDIPNSEFHIYTNDSARLLILSRYVVINRYSCSVVVYHLPKNMQHVG